MATQSGQAMIASQAALMAISGVAVVLRIIARSKRSLPLEADDFLIMAAWFFAAALSITNIISVPVGNVGTPFESLSEDQSKSFLKFLFAMQFWYLFAVAFVKYSILCFYGRIFSIGRFPITVKILIAITTAWLVSFFFATLFQVWPIWCNWTICPPTTDYPVMYLLTAITDIILDISILCLPALFISRLRLTSTQKVGVTGIFGLGIFCVVASIARMVYSIGIVQADNANDFAANFDTASVNFTMWCGIEACASVICANLPCYSPFIGNARSLTPFLAYMRSMFSIRSSKRSRSSKKQSDGTSSSTEDVISGDKTIETHIEGLGTHYTPEQEMEMGQITVKTTMNIRED